MKTSLFVAAAVAAVLATPAAFAVDPVTSPSAAIVQDSPITSSVNSALKAENSGNFANIQVNTDSNGVVWLKGNVASQADADRAVAIAKGTANVKSVRSELAVKSGY